VNTTARSRHPRPVARLPLTALRQFLRAVPDSVHAEVISRLANHLLRGQALSRRLAPIEGSCLCLVISDTGNVWRFRVRAGRLLPQPAGEPPDVCIQGELMDFLLLATRGEDPDTLFFARRLSLEGDTETGLFVKNQLDALEFDWEAHVSAVAGPHAARMLQSVLRRTGLDRLFGALARGLVAQLAAIATTRG
jgi:predicted lipid carrier protein YhbT